MTTPLSTPHSCRVTAVANDDLTPVELEGLGRLFDGEYLDHFGSWTPDCPYGYSPADIHVIASCDGVIIGHVGMQKRIITVGENNVTVAGIGGVLVHADWRGRGIGIKLMRAAQTTLRDKMAAEFGYLGCRPSIVGFYETAGWRRIHVTERSLSRLDGTTVTTNVDPILICPGTRDVTDWPTGDVDLRGRPW